MFQRLAHGTATMKMLTEYLERAHEFEQLAASEQNGRV
jgi:hypothetical protein